MERSRGVEVTERSLFCTLMFRKKSAVIQKKVVVIVVRLFVDLYVPDAFHYAEIAKSGRG